MLVKTFGTYKPVSSSFDPSDLSPIAWYDFSDSSLLFTDAGTTNVSSDGDAIYQANDKSGSGFHLVQTTSSARPTYKTSIQNGLSVSRFDGTDDHMAWPIVNSASNYTFVFAGDFTDSSGTRSERILHEGSAVLLLTLQQSGSYAHYDGSYKTYGTKQAGKQNLVWTLNSTGTAATLHRNGSQIGVAQSYTQKALTGTSYLVQNSTTVLIGDIYEIIVFNSALSTGDRQNLETWVNNKWSIY